MNTSTLIPSQNDGLLPVIFGNSEPQQEEFTPYEVVKNLLERTKGENISLKLTRNQLT